MISYARPPRAGTGSCRELEMYVPFFALMVLGWAAASVLWAPAYAPTVVALTIVGLVLSSFFVLSWTPSAFRARFKGLGRATWFELVDMAGLPCGIFVLYALSVFNLLVVGVTPAPTLGVRVARVLSIVIFDVIVGMRAYRWARILATGEPVVHLHRRRASSNHDNALEGSDDRNPAGHS